MAAEAPAAAQVPDEHAVFTPPEHQYPSPHNALVQAVDTEAPAADQVPARQAVSVPPEQ